MVPALVDTGAGANVVNLAMVDRLRGGETRHPTVLNIREWDSTVKVPVKQIWKGYETEHEAQTVDGGRVEITERYHVPIEIGDCEVVVNALHMPTSKYPLILGVNFLAEHGMVVDTGRQVLVLGNGDCIKLRGIKYARPVKRHTAKRTVIASL